MSESVKPRFAIDLNEIERQLAQAGNPHPQQAPVGAERSAGGIGPYCGAGRSFSVDSGQ